MNITSTRLLPQSPINTIRKIIIEQGTPTVYTRMEMKTKDSIIKGRTRKVKRLLKHNLKLSTPTRSAKYAPRRLLQNILDSENDPPPTMVSPSKFAMVRQLNRSRLPLEDHDHNSQDSGISDDSKSSEFRFLEPSGAPPKRLSSMEMSPRHYPTSPRFDKASFSPRRNLCFSSHASSDSGASMESASDDGFMSLFHQDKELDENAQLPGSSTLGNLLSARILSSTPPKSPPRTLNNPASRSPGKHRPPFRRSVSENITPNMRMGDDFCLKRPLLMDNGTPLSKRFKPLSLLQEKGTLFQYGFKATPVPSLLSPPHSITPSPPSFSPQTSPAKITHSCSESDIKLALQRSTQEELIGDFSRPFSLPLLSGKHDDLKTISCDTLAHLIGGKYEQSITSFEIIDCRYPYEYEGGHIKGAVNLYTRDQITQELIKKKQNPDSKSSRHILVFHCEFSSERGPCLFRWLRKEDRAGNTYPRLNYPELYLLEGGYKAFFSKFSDLCEPKSYKSMADPNHASDLKHFRAKSKSWAGNHHKKITMRNLSRLGF